MCHAFEIIMLVPHFSLLVPHCFFIFIPFSLYASGFCVNVYSTYSIFYSFVFNFPTVFHCLLLILSHVYSTFFHCLFLKVCVFSSFYIFLFQSFLSLWFILTFCSHFLFFFLFCFLICSYLYLTFHIVFFILLIYSLFLIFLFYYVFVLHFFPTFTIIVFVCYTFFSILKFFNELLIFMVMNTHVRITMRALCVCCAAVL